MNIFQTISAAAVHGPEVETKLLGLGPEGWVYAGITIFFLIAIFGAKAHRQVLGVLDAQIAETRKSLEEASAIRTEAEALLADAKRQQAESARHAMTIIEHAKHEAEAIIAKAQADTNDVILRRERMAHDKIGAAERAAVEALRAKAAQAAASAARGLIAANHDAKADKALVDGAIAGL